MANSESNYCNVLQLWGNDSSEMHVVILILEIRTLYGFNIAIVNTLLDSLFNGPEKILISTIPDNPEEAVCFKVLIDLEGVIIRCIGLLAVSANSGRETLNVRPVSKQINHTISSYEIRSNQLSKTPVRLPAETT